MNINKAIIIGRITNDLELKAMPNGNKVLSFSVATNRTWKNEAGEKQEKASYHNVVVFGKTAEIIKRYFIKGQEIYVEGYLDTQSWEDKDTKKKMYRTEIILSTFDFGQKPQNAPKEDTQESQKETGGLEDEYNQDINPEDIPF